MSCAIQSETVQSDVDRKEATGCSVVDATLGKDLSHGAGDCEETSWQDACEEFLCWLSTKRWQEPAKADVPQSSARRQRYSRLAFSLAALLMLAASFRAGQILPPERLAQALEQLLPNDPLLQRDSVEPRSQSSNSLSEPPEPNHEGECRLVRLSSKSCGQCGKRQWPLMKPEESCPYCGSTSESNTLVGEPAHEKGSDRR